MVAAPAGPDGQARGGEGSGAEEAEGGQAGRYAHVFRMIEQHSLLDSIEVCMFLYVCSRALVASLFCARVIYNSTLVFVQYSTCVFGCQLL